MTRHCRAHAAPVLVRVAAMLNPLFSGRLVQRWPRKRRSPDPLNLSARRSRIAPEGSKSHTRTPNLASEHVSDHAPMLLSLPACAMLCEQMPPCSPRRRCSQHATSTPAAMHHAQGCSRSASPAASSLLRLQRTHPISVSLDTTPFSTEILLTRMPAVTSRASRILHFPFLLFASLDASGLSFLAAACTAAFAIVGLTMTCLSSHSAAASAVTRLAWLSAS